MPGEFFPPPKKVPGFGIKKIIREVQYLVNTFHRAITFRSNIILEGDISSSTWDGANQVPGSGATAGYFLDSSTGAAEFSELFGDMKPSTLLLLAVDATDEGGQMEYDGAGAHTIGIVTDRFQDVWRVIVDNNAVLQVAETALIIAPSGTEVARFTGDAGHNLQGLAWTTWTPTLTNLNVGSSGVVVAKYVQIGDTVHAHFRATLGGTGISVGDVRVSLPVEMGAALNLEPLGPCLLRDTGTATVAGVIEVVNTTSVVFREYNVSGSLIVTAAISSTSPFTWVAGDILAFNITYEAA